MNEQQYIDAIRKVIFNTAEEIRSRLINSSLYELPIDMDNNHHLIVVAYELGRIDGINEILAQVDQTSMFKAMGFEIK